MLSLHAYYDEFNFIAYLYYQELIIVVRESIQHAIGMCKMSA